MSIDTNKIFFSSQVDAAKKGMRLDKFLRDEFPEMSRSMVQRLIQSGNVGLDDSVITDNDFKVRTDDSFVVTVPPPTEANPQPENIPLEVVYEDEDLIVVNKPAGMTVHPAPGAYSGTLVNALLHHCKDNLSGVGGVKRPGIVHRIDKDTSGLLVVAKSDFAHQKLSEQFVDHSIERTYYAVVYGVPNPLSGKVVGNIARSNFDRKKMALVKVGGKYACTNYKCIKQNSGGVSLLRCNLETGRTHQIRVHMSSIGCALVGDKVYVKSGKTRIKVLDDTLVQFLNDFPRQALHAATLGFVHPRTKNLVQFESALPDDMQLLIEKACLL